MAVGILGLVFSLFIGRLTLSHVKNILVNSNHFYPGILLSINQQHCL